MSELTVGAVAQLLGVTVRTLHHWDEIGLASPSVRTSAGYRTYTDADLQRLRRILAYRETGLSLDAIRGILDDPATDIVATLRSQRSRLAERIADLHRLDERLERLADAHEHGIPADAAEHTTMLDPGSARLVWGGTVQWAQFAERSAARTSGQWRALVEAMASLERDLGDAHDSGALAGGATANALADRHRELFSNFFPITRQMQVCLARMFEADPGFAAHYDGIRPGLASWFRQSVDGAARTHGIDPDTATWPG